MATLLAALMGCTPMPSAQTAVETELARPTGRRAIFVSYDSFSEDRALALPAEVAPALQALFAEGACARGAVPAFPSLTAPGHAALWTGAYGNVTGVSGNTQLRLPRDRHTLNETISGYSSDALRAEPIWITAGAAGLRVVGHHPTQAPGVPGYPAVDGERDARLSAARERAARVLAQRNVSVFNGYNRTITGDLALTQDTLPARVATGWQNVQRLGRTLPPREIAWTVGSDSVFALLHGDGRYSRVLVSASRDASRGVIAHAAPVERDPIRGRALARHFSEALELPVENGRVFLRVRLFAIADDASSYMLFVPALQVVEANRPEVRVAYESGVRGWVGNGASRLLGRGVFGREIHQGGDGSAELHYLETAELVTRQFIAGARWSWQTLQPSLMIDYLPLVDEIDHLWYGHVAPGTPASQLPAARRYSEVRHRGWTLVDLHFTSLLELVAGDTSAAIFVSGDHGMRPSWRLFRPNAALREAGLLALDSAGRVDLSRTRALSPNGYWVNVNRAAWRGGIVPEAEAQMVLQEAERALLAHNTPEGGPIVTQLWRGADHDSLGIGGPAGGDLYWDTAEGYRWTWVARGPVSEAADPDSGHGFPSTSPDMHTVLCARGPAFLPRRIPTVRTIDAAPTVAEWLGTPAPADARGRSRLTELRLGR